MQGPNHTQGEAGAGVEMLVHPRPLTTWVHQCFRARRYQYEAGRSVSGWGGLAFSGGGLASDLAVVQPWR